MTANNSEISMLKQSLQTMLKQREIQDQQAYDLESQNAS